MFRSLLVAAAAIALLAPAASAADTPDAEIFATDNTALITDPDDPRLDDPLTEFARAVDRIVDRGGGEPRGSELLDGVFFSSDLGGTTFERSRRFDVDRVSDSELHAIADRVRRRFLQQSVLTFDHLRRRDRDVDAILLEVPGVSAQALRDGLIADPEAQERLFGGSVTLDGRLLLVAALEDAGLARAFAERIGGDLGRSRTSFGEREFVEGGSPVRIEDGTLLIEGGPGDDRLEIEPDGDRIEIELGHERFEARLDAFQRIRAELGGGADSVEIGDLRDGFGEEVRLDLGAADGRADRVAVAGSRDDDQTSVLAFGASVAVLGPAFVAIDGAEPGDRLHVGGGDGDDILSASTAAMRMTLDGGRGSDVLLGSPGDDLLIGGDDFDDVKGGRGDDVASLGGDFDRFSWAPGDGSDSVDGGASRDSLFFRGTDAPEAFGVQADGRRVRFTRDADGVALELSDLEEIDTLAGGGADTVAIDDLTGTPVELVDVSLANAFSAPGGDGQPDRVAVTGTPRDDRLTLTGRVVVAGTATLTGLGARVNVSHAEGAADTLAIDTRGGNDTVDTSAFDPATIGLAVD